MKSSLISVLLIIILIPVIVAVKQNSVSKIGVGTLYLVSVSATPNLVLKACTGI